MGARGTDTTADAIERRIRQAIADSHIDDEADQTLLHELTADLELAGGSLDQVSAILRAVASLPDVHYGSPGPLVFFIEAHPDYEAVLFPIARTHPRECFVWMLERIANARDTHAETALEILRAYASGRVSDVIIDSELRARVDSYLGYRDHGH